MFVKVPVSSLSIKISALTILSPVWALVTIPLRVGGFIL
jgi:hypothetical protein